MPTYDYVCDACGHRWESIQNIKDAPEKECPKCKEEKAKRLISGGSSFILKGGGWAVDGYSR